MSNALAISGVTAILQHYLGILYANVHDQLPSVTVSCLAPDQVQQTQTGASGAGSQVNLFLHQVTHNAAWRNVDQPSMSGTGLTRLKSPPLALDLHYLLTFYGTEYWEAEALLGYALMMLHEAPVLTRDDVRNALTAVSGTPSGSPPYPSLALTGAVVASGLADQIEMIKITPSTLGREEMAWLWTALKADYRPTYPFQVSVVLMQPAQQTSLALPVLLRKFQARPVQPVRILEIKPPTNQGTARPNDTVTVTGEFLKGPAQVVISNTRYDVQLTIPATAANNVISFVLPGGVAQYPAAMYNLAVQILDTTGAIVQTTNSLALAVAPTLPTQTATVTSNAQGKLVTITNISPPAWPGQTISLALSNLAAPYERVSAAAVAYTGQVTTLSFQFNATLPTGALLGRLVIDGVPSQVQVNTLVFPPTFTDPMVTV